jgi:hypothetical protein
MVTAEEFVLERWSEIPSDPDEVFKLMVEFAKMHVEAALTESKDRLIQIDHGFGVSKYVETFYPISNIK